MATRNNTTGDQYVYVNNAYDTCVVEWVSNFEVTEFNHDFIVNTVARRFGVSISEDHADMIYYMWHAGVDFESYSGHIERIYF